MNTITFELSQDLLEIKSLLLLNQLPVEDITEGKIDFIVAREQDEILGCIGVEKFGSEGLLRSFAVLPQLQHKGIGMQLYDRLLEYAKTQNINTLHLLTNTASKYFERNGFKLTERKLAPHAIQESTEFAGLCPVTSTYMTLELTTAHV